VLDRGIAESEKQARVWHIDIYHFLYRLRYPPCYSSVIARYAKRNKCRYWGNLRAILSVKDRARAASLLGCYLLLLTRMVHRLKQRLASASRSKLVAACAYGNYISYIYIYMKYNYIYIYIYKAIARMFDYYSTIRKVVRSASEAKLPRKIAASCVTRLNRVSSEENFYWM